MITLIASIIGFMSSSLPHIFSFLQDKSDKKQELLLLDKQIEMQKMLSTSRLDEVRVNADAAQMQALYNSDSRNSGVRWIEGLRASVRPVLTYAFFMFFIFVKVSALINFIKTGVPMTVAVTMIWDIETSALFVAVITFWFGERAFRKLGNQLIK